MSKDYNVDDILAEVNRKRAVPTAKPQAVAPTLPPSPSRGPKEIPPFQLSGMTEEFAPPDKESAPVAKARASAPMPRKQEQFTRMSIPIPTATGDAPTPNPAKSVGATRAIPAITESDLDATLEETRQQKIKEFMQRSTLASSHNADDDEDDDEDVEEEGGIARFFQGFAHSNILQDKGRRTEATDEPYKKSEKSGAKPRRERQGEAHARTPLTDEVEFEGEYTIPRDSVSVNDDILSIKRSLSVRLLANLACFVALLYLALCNLFPLPMLTALAPETDMRLFMLTNLMLLLISALFSNTVVGSGLLSLFTFKPDHDTPAALAVLSVIAHAVAIIVTPGFLNTGDTFFYYPVAALILLMNTMGKRMMILRIAQNFEIASSDTVFQGEYILKDDPVAKNMAEGQGLDNPHIAYCKPVGFPQDFMKLSYTDDYAESVSRIISPMFLLFGLALALVSRFAFSQTGTQALTVFCVVMCMASPLTNTLVGSLPLWRASKLLSREKAFVSGYDAVELFEDMNAVAMDALELYPADKIVLHGIKAFAQGRVDESIVEAASIMNAANGLLKEVFWDVIGQKESMLRSVTDFVCYDGGIGAVVGGMPVLMGSRALMEHNGITAPSRDYEKKFLKGDRNLLYLAENGEVTAMFVLGYTPGEDAARWLNVIAPQQLSLLIRCSDPNITPAKVANDFNYPEEFIKIIPSQLNEEYDTLTAPAPKGEAFAMSTGKIHRLRLLAAASGLKKSIVSGTVLQLAGLIVGYALTAFLAFTGSIETMGFLQLMIYQLFWALAVVIVPNLKSY